MNTEFTINELSIQNIEFTINLLIMHYAFCIMN